MSHARRYWTVIIAGALLLCSMAVRADYKNDYQDGLDAAQKNNWSEVQRLMRSALAENGSPSARMRTYSTIYVPYVPHYYLGLAHAKLGDCLAAIDAFGNAASSKVVAGIPALASTQTQEQTRCAQMLAQAQPEPPIAVPSIPSPPVVASNPVVASTDKAPVSTPSIIPTATATLSAKQIAATADALAQINQKIDAITQQLRSQPLAGSGDARALGRDLDALGERRLQAGTKLERARNAGDSRLLTSVDGEAAELTRSLSVLEDRVRSASAGLAQAQEARALELTRQRASTALAQLEQTLKDAYPAAVSDSATAKAANAAGTRLQQASAGTDRKTIDVAIESLVKASGNLEKAIAAAPKPAPEQLRTLTQWYLAAQYAQAAGWDQLDRLPDARARAQALLLRAASRWHLYVRGGEQDGKLSAAVDIDLREAKRLDESLKPNPVAFSPRLINRLARL